VSDDELWRAFSEGTLPATAWTHREHLRMAWMFTQRHELDEAHLLMRVGIIRLNAAHGLVETAQRGYHETITRVWLIVIRALLREERSRSETSSAFVDSHHEQLGKDALLKHYSRERLMSVAARARFVDPDLAPLPGM
jgi:hypothetical protein